jgi:hypothetical protein
MLSRGSPRSVVGNVLTPETALYRSLVAGLFGRQVPNVSEGPRFRATDDPGSKGERISQILPHPLEKLVGSSEKYLERDFVTLKRIRG